MARLDARNGGGNAVAVQNARSELMQSGKITYGTSLKKEDPNAKFAQFKAQEKASSSEASPPKKDTEASELSASQKLGEMILSVPTEKQTSASYVLTDQIQKLNDVTISVSSELLPTENKPQEQQEKTKGTEQKNQSCPSQVR